MFRLGCQCMSACKCSIIRQLHIASHQSLQLIQNIFKKSQPKTADWTRFVFCFQKRKKKKRRKEQNSSKNQDTQSVEMQEKGKWEKNVAVIQVPPSSHCHSICRLCLHQVSSVLQHPCWGMPELFLPFQHFCPYQGSSASLAEHSGWLTACRRILDCSKSCGLFPNWISSPLSKELLTHTDFSIAHCCFKPKLSEIAEQHVCKTQKSAYRKCFTWEKNIALLTKCLIKHCSAARMTSIYSGLVSQHDPVLLK